MIEFIEGPLWYLALAIFVLGVAWRLIALASMKRPADLSQARTNSGGIGGALKALLLHSVPHGGNLGRTLYHFFTGYLFHIGLFVLVLFAAPHVDFIQERLIGSDIGWPKLPRWGFIIAAEAAFAGLILLYVHRLTDPVKKQLTDIDDHLGVWLTFIVMLTGCLALQEAHAGLRAFHLLTVEALMIYFPFSRLMHAFTFAFARTRTGLTYGRRGFTP
jgi:nitrate reductase gamma subunit